MYSFLKDCEDTKKIVFLQQNKLKTPAKTTSCCVSVIKKNKNIEK